MKKSLISFLLISLAGIALASCNIYTPFLSSETKESSSYTYETPSRPDTSDGYYKVDGNSFRPYLMKDIYNSYGADTVPSTGNVKILVLPIEFSDYKFSSDFSSKLSIALQGEGEEGTTGYWESLASFYRKSSYGKLNLSFEIASIYKPNMSAKSAYDNYGSSQTNSDNGVTLTEAALANYRSSHSLTQFDSDGNGFIDGVIAVYSCPNGNSGKLSFNDATDYFWAYTFWANNDPNRLNPTMSTYFWLSQDFLINNNGIDAHTLIHEFGHMLGLDDYYPESGSRFNPTGGSLMMDHNILDHDSYSKAVLGWTDPIVVDEDCTVEIGPANSTGDCIVIPTGSWNGTVYDEYLLLELYTPDGLNYLDSHVRYNNGLLGYTVPGIKIYHIDSRVMEINVKGNTNYTYDAEYYSNPKLNPGNRTFYKVGATNCQKDYAYADSSFSLIHLLEATGINTFKNGYYGNDMTLFKSNSKFTSAKFRAFFPNGLKYNNGDYIDIEIDVNEVSSTKASLTFRYN